MVNPTLVLAGLLLSVSTCLARPEGFFESEDCADPSGLSECNAAAAEKSRQCQDEECKDGDADCLFNCGCEMSISSITCAQQNCWNLAYSCEYQSEVSAMLNCVEREHPYPQLEGIPFWPPPDDAETGCSCNKAKVEKALMRASEEWESVCGVEAKKGVSSQEEIKAIDDACLCCLHSASLSANIEKADKHGHDDRMWDICPNTDPALLGADVLQEHFPNMLEGWKECGASMEAYACDEVLGMTPPAGNTTNFYAPGEFPKNGTETTTYNTGPEITSPVSGESYTWTYNGVEHPVTVRGYEAQATGSSEDGTAGEGEEGGEGEGEVKEGAGASMAPGMLVWSFAAIMTVLALY